MNYSIRQCVSSGTLFIYLFIGCTLSCYGFRSLFGLAIKTQTNKQCLYDETDVLSCAYAGRLIGRSVGPLVGGFGPLENHIRYVTKPSQSTD